MCRTLVDLVCKVYLNAEEQKVGVWTEEMGKVNFPMVRIQPMGCQLYHSHVNRLHFIQTCSDLSSLETNLPSRRRV